MTMLYFAWVREMVGTDREAVVVPDGVETVSALLDWLAGRSDGHAAALADRSRIRVALDDDYVQPEALIAGAREVAIFPPVTGG
jgi:molybdopterin synthase sulfur carrier subunit